MEFWNSLLTQRSWDLMQKLKDSKFRFIVIGGWATYLLTKQNKSKDIDIIITDFKDLEEISKNYDLKKNDNLKKYEIKIEEIDIDIYIPYYSKITLPIDFISRHTVKIESFEVASPEVLLILKQGAELDRKDRIKGQKDRIDIMTLVCYSDINLKSYLDILEQYDLIGYYKRLKEIIKSFKEIKYLNINLRNYSKIKKRLVEELS